MTSGNVASPVNAGRLKYPARRPTPKTFGTLSAVAPVRGSIAVSVTKNRSLSRPSVGLGPEAVRKMDNPAGPNVPVVSVEVTSPGTVKELKSEGIGAKRIHLVLTGPPHVVRFVIATRSPARTSTGGLNVTV